MATKMKSKTIILIVVISILLLTLCACNDPTNQTRNVSIGLPVNNGPAFDIGMNFNVVKAISYNFYGYYEILPNQLDEFLSMLEKQDCYSGKIILDDISKIFPYEIEPFKSNDECMWFSHEGSVWVGKTYTNKFFYIAQVYNSFLDGDDYFGEISSFLFNETSAVTKIIADTEYSTSLNWEDIKKVCDGFSVDEDNRSIQISCYVHTDEDPDRLTVQGFTTLVYNEENGTIKILNECVKK